MTDKSAPVDISRELELISDAEVTRVHGHANFGDMAPRDVIRDGVVKYAMGYTGGHTQLSILIEHALIHKPKPGSYQSTLTKKGRAYLRAIMPTWGVLTALRAALDAADARERQAVEATLDAAHEYLVAVYGHSPLAHPVDRARIAAIRAGGKP